MTIIKRILLFCYFTSLIICLSAIDIFPETLSLNQKSYIYDNFCGLNCILKESLLFAKDGKNIVFKDRRIFNDPVKKELLDYQTLIADPEAEFQKITAPDGTYNNLFGTSVAIDGNTMIIGTPSARNESGVFQGAAYVFIRSGINWTFQAKLDPIDGSINEQFGTSVAISGDSVVIGAKFADVGQNSAQGAAYIFTRNGFSWSLQQKIFANDGLVGSGFGNSIAIHNDTVAVGAVGDRINGLSKGSAYIFTRNNGTWTQQAKLIDIVGNGTQFGFSVAIENNTAVIGSKFAQVGINFAQGAACVFQRNGMDWTQQIRLSASDGNSDDLFGASVSIDGANIIVGAESARAGTNIRSGAAYIFTFDGTNWVEQQKIAASDSNSGKKFGGSVDISGEIAVIGANLDLIGSNDRQGSLYVFVKNGGNWTQQSKLISSDGIAGDNFGYSVAVSGDKLVVGAPNADIEDNLSQGVAYFFIKPPIAPDLQATSDTGINNSDNLTKNRNVVFDIGGVTTGATIELLRNGILVDSLVAIGNTVSLTDVQTPANGTFQYTSRQIVNGEESSQSEVTFVTIDTTLPTVVVNRSSPDPTVNLPLQFDFTFSESVFGFDEADISLAGSTANISGAIIALSPSGGNFFLVNNIVSDGQFVQASIPTEGFTDAAGNSNLASTSTDNIIILDNVRPRVFINQAVTQADPTASQPINFTVTFSEPVTGFNANDIWLLNSTANTSGAVINITGSGLTYNVTISGLISNGQTIRAEMRPGNVLDALGNGNDASISTDNIVTLDNVAPTVTINQAVEQVDPTSNQPINFRVIFSEAVSGFASLAISLSGSTANVSIANISVTGNGTTYNVAISNITSSGQVRASVVIGAAQDALGNLSFPSTSTDNTITVNTRRSPFDFDGDGKTDLSIFRPSNGQWWYLKSGGSGNVALQFGESTDRLVPGDYTGDGKTDIAFFRPSTSEWFILRSENFSFFSFPFGASGDIPAPADYDGDGKTDAAVFRPSNQTWYIQKSTGGDLIVQFGFAEDKPVVADYDGDGKADIAIFRPSVGQWWYLRSSDGANRAYAFGLPTDKPVPGDYTGDGKADLAFFRPSDNSWYILRSEDDSFFAFPFGATGDIPSPGDYDGDGKIDATVFRPSNATWFSNRSTAGLLVVGFGFSEDRPVPNAFVP